MRGSRSLFTAVSVGCAALGAVVALPTGRSVSYLAAPAAPHLELQAVGTPTAFAPQPLHHTVKPPAPVVTKAPVARSVPHVASRQRRLSAPHPAAPRVVPRTAPQPAPRPSPSPSPAAQRVRTGGDDYPYGGSGTDRWGFTERQCVSFAAWRLSQHGTTLDNGAQHWGDARNWDDVAAARGVTVSSRPRVGAVAQWNAGESSSVRVSGGSGSFQAGSFGHVGWVAAVYDDGTALVESYNAQGTRSYSTMRTDAPRYLLF